MIIKIINAGVTMTAKTPFGQWLKQRRKALDLTYEDLAGRIGCAVITLYKIEANERRPSKQVATLLAVHLNIPPAEREAFVRFARTDDSDAAVPWGTPFHPPTNLPAPPTVLIGRDVELAAIRKRLLQADLRLLTLTGPPGIGKTRLSLQVAAAMLDDFPAGVFFVALAPITDPHLVPTTIANTLGISDAGPQTPLERLKVFLRDKYMLLVLDNVEQLLASASHIAELLAACPLLKLLVTSRVPLRIRSERQFLVSPLALPDLTHLPDLASLTAYAAVALFIERAQAVKSEFMLTSDNAPTIAAICARLDGLPLAIELISARIKLLSPTTLLERLSGRLLLHSDGMNDLEPRHRTLNAAIDWSYQLLPAAEQHLLRRLSVFVGGWTLEAVEAVCIENLNLNVLEGLASLLDKNLVKHDTSVDGEPRFTMLETIREFALDRLIGSGELAVMQHYHATYFLALAERPRPNLTGVQMRLLWNQFELEHDNFRAALTWSRTESTGEIQPRLALALANFWRARGRIMEGERWLADAQARDQAAKAAGTLTKTRLRLRAHVLDWLAIFRLFQGDVGTTLNEESLAIFQELGDKAGIADMLSGVGMQKLELGDYEQAGDFLEQSLALYRELGVFYNIVLGHFFLGMLAYAQRRIQQAGVLWEESLVGYHTMGDPVGAAMVLTCLAKVMLDQSNFSQANAYLVESLTGLLEIDEHWHIITTLDVCACLAAVREPPTPLRSARLFGAVERQRELLSLSRMLDNQYLYDQSLTSLRSQLNQATLESAWAEGRAMTFDQVVAYALET